MGRRTDLNREPNCNMWDVPEPSPNSPEGAANNIELILIEELIQQYETEDWNEPSEDWDENFDMSDSENWKEISILEDRSEDSLPMEEEPQQTTDSEKEEDKETSSYQEVRVSIISFLCINLFFLVSSKSFSPVTRSMEN